MSAVVQTVCAMPNGLLAWNVGYTALHEIGGVDLFCLHKLSENCCAQLRNEIRVCVSAPSVSVSSVKRKLVLMFPFLISDKDIYPLQMDLYSW